MGPASVQFDLRFYVVALLFLIFEVEVAFFFPPATVFGKATHLLASEASRRSDVERRISDWAAQREILRSLRMTFATSG